MVCQGCRRGGGLRQAQGAAGQTTTVWLCNCQPNDKAFKARSGGWLRLTMDRVGHSIRQAQGEIKLNEKGSMRKA